MTDGVSEKSGVPGDKSERRRIAEVIAEASRGGRFQRHQLRRRRQLQTRIDRLKAKLARCGQAQAKQARRQVDQVVTELRAASAGKSHDEQRVFVHVDLDAFFAAVEQRDHPEWRGRPLAVGGGPSSVLSTANYTARQWGVASAMPTYIALRLCPDLLIVPHRGSAYVEASE
jgi:DNA polymerase kappa